MKVIWDFDNLFAFGERVANYSKYIATLEKTTQEIAKAVHSAVNNRIPIDSGRLKQGWNTGENLSFRVQKTKKGFLVELTNDVEYAASVNYGHRVKNRKDGPYLMVKNRVKVPVADKRQKPKNDYWVYGHFFLENGIAEAEEQVEQIIYKELQKWLEWCVNG